MQNNHTKQKSILAFVISWLAVFATLFSFRSNGYVKAEDGIPFEIEKNEISSVLILCDESLDVQPGQERNLTVSIFPEVANETLVKVEYQIVRGAEQATILNNKLIVSDIASIGAQVEIVAIVDDVVSENSLVFVVQRIAVAEVQINTEVDTISQGEVLNLQTIVLPANATNPSVVYEVEGGQDYVTINIDGKIVVTGNLPAGDLTATIRATSLSDPEIFCKKTFKLYKPIESIVLANSNLTQVEQQRSYSFAANVEPYTATFGNQNVTYSLNVSNKIATIDENGLLTIASTAPIGCEIIVRIDATDGVFVEQKVTVVPVYATKFAIKNHTAPTFEGKYLPNDQIVFETEFLEPFNITESNKVFAIKISDESLAKVIGNTVVVNNLNQIKVKNPNLIATVYTIQNGVELSEDVKIDIYVPVTNIDLTANLQTLIEGKTYDLAQLLTYSIYPTNSNIRTADFVLTNNQFATIANGQLIVKSDLPEGNINFDVYATAGQINSNIITFNVYKPTKTLKLEADSTNPISKISIGEQVNLSTIVSKTASVNAPQLTIVSGADKIEGSYKDGDIIPASFAIKPNLSNVKNLNKQIVLQAEQDGIISCLEIIVYIPNETMQLTANLLKRGVINSFKVQNSSNADDIKWEIVSVDSCVNYVDTNTNKIKINQNTPAGTEITVTYRSLDRVGSVFTSIFKVDNIDYVNSEAVYIDSGAVCNDQKFNAIIGYDSEKVAISRLRTQLQVNRYTDIKIKYMGCDLIDFGLKLCKVEVSNNATAYLQNYDTIRLKVNNDASGKTTVSMRVTVQDGTSYYTLEYNKLFNVFRPLQADKIVLTNDYFINQCNDLNFDQNLLKDLTYGVENFKFAVVNQEMTEVKYVNGRLSFVINSINATSDEYSYFNINCVEEYNNQSSTYSQDIKVNIRKVSVNLDNGTGSDALVLVNDLSQSCGEFTRVGYKFNGLYTDDATQYYDASSNLCVDHLQYKDCQTLTAKWTPITYTVYFYWKIDGEDNWRTVQFKDNTYGDWGFGATYDVYQTVKDYPISGVIFKHWTLNDSDDVYSYEKCPGYLNLTTKDGDSVYFRGHCDREPIKCVTTGTMITLADGSQKPVEDLTKNDNLLVWNFYTGQFDSAPVSFMISHGVDEYEILTLTFEDNTIVNVSGEHGFWDIDLGKYIFLSKNNAQDYIGHKFVKEFVDDNGERKTKSVELTGAEVKTELTNTYSPMSDKHLCVFVNGMLSVSTETEGLVNYFDVVAGGLKIDEQKMQQDILKYGLMDYQTYFEGLVSKEIYESVNAKYLSISIAKGLISKEKIAQLIEDYAKYFVVGGAD